MRWPDALNTTHHLDWWKSVCTEFENCENKQVWLIVQKSNVPKGRKIIGNRRVFVRKDDGRYLARTVAKGFIQIPGQYFQENHAPVINDTTFHLILVLKLLFGLKSKQFDNETAFLYGTLEDEIYVQFSDGYERYLQTEKRKDVSAKDHCLLLLKSLYGFVQAARQWYKKIADIFAKLDFIASSADP
jgi:Reverse transcriptase (RNA-dependent DNA polymerase)